MIYLLLFILGTLVGSFLNVVILRLPRSQRILGRSHCLHCGHVLSALDLIPIVSYLFLRGNCRYCRKKISARYVFIEILTGVLTALSFFFYFSFIDGASYLGFARAAFIVFVCIVVFVIDYEHFLILDTVVLPSALILFILNLASDLFYGRDPLQSLSLVGLISGLAIGAFFWLIHIASAGRWIGLGDAKFAVFLGLATPFPLILVNLFLAFGLGSCFGIILIILGRKGMKSQLPFGAFLSISTVIALFFGNKMLDWYLKLVGL